MITNGWGGSRFHLEMMEILWVLQCWSFSYFIFIHSSKIVCTALNGTEKYPYYFHIHDSFRYFVLFSITVDGKKMSPQINAFIFEKYHITYVELWTTGNSGNLSSHTFSLYYITYTVENCLQSPYWNKMD